MNKITTAKEHLESAKRLTGDAYIGADMDKECDKAYSEICKALKIIDDFIDRGDNGYMVAKASEYIRAGSAVQLSDDAQEPKDEGVYLSDDEWEDMVNKQECMNAEIADCNEEISGLKAENQTLKNCVFHLQEALKELGATAAPLCPDGYAMVSRHVTEEIMNEMRLCENGERSFKDAWEALIKAAERKPE